MATKDRGEGGKVRLETSVVESVRKILKSDDSPFKDFDIQGFEAFCELKLCTASREDVLKEGRYTHYVRFKFDYFRRAATLDNFAGDPASLKGRKVQVLNFRTRDGVQDYDGVVDGYRREGDGTYSFRIQYEDDERFSWMSAERLALRTAPWDQTTFAKKLHAELVADEEKLFDPLEHTTRDPTKGPLPSVLLHNEGFIYMRVLKDPKWNTLVYEAQIRARTVIAGKILKAMRRFYASCRADMPQGSAQPRGGAPGPVTIAELVADNCFARIVYEKAGLRDHDTSTPNHKSCKAGPFDGLLTKIVDEKGTTVVDSEKTNREKLCFSNMKPEDRIRGRPYLIKNFVALCRLFLGPLAAKSFKETWETSDFDNMTQLVQRIPWLRKELIGADDDDSAQIALCERLRKNRNADMHLKVFSKAGAQAFVDELCELAKASGVEAEDVRKIAACMRLKLIDPREMGEEQLREAGYAGLLREQRDRAKEAEAHRERLASEATKDRERRAYEAVDDRERVANEAEAHRERLESEAKHDRKCFANDAAKDRERLFSKLKEIKETLSREDSRNSSSSSSTTSKAIYDGPRKCAPPTLGADFVGGLRNTDVVTVTKLILDSSSRDLEGDNDSTEATKTPAHVRTGRKIGVHGVNGLGGLGKTVLAKQLCSEKPIRERFRRGGMFWLTASNENPLEELRKLVEDLVKIHAPDTDLEKELGACVDMETALGKAFELFKRVDAPVLVVLDDVWEARRVKQLVSMDALPKGSVVLMTYRKRSIGDIVGAEPYALKKLSKRSATTLFESKSGVKCDDDETLEIVELLVKRLGYHPMAIAIVGGLARRRLLDVDSDLKVVHSTLLDMREKLKDGFVYDDDDDEDNASKTAIDGETWLRTWLAEMELGDFFDDIWKAGFRTKKRVRDRMTARVLEKYCSSLAPMDIDELLDGVKKLKEEELKRETLKKERRHTCVRHCIGESVKFLEKAERDCFMEFAIFPEDTSIPYGVLARLVSEKTQDRLDALVEASLVERSASKGIVSYRLHDLCRDYVREVTKDKRGAMHMRFLNTGGDASVDGVPLHGYRSRLNGTGGSRSVTKTTEASKNDNDVDAYIANQACWHMLQAAKCGVEEARTMMIKTAFSVSWLEARARQRARGGGVGAVLTDLVTASDAMAASKQKKDSQALSRVIGLVRSAVGMSAQRLTEKPEMMAECLWQRLILHCRDGTSGGASLKAEAGTAMLKGLVLRDVARRQKELGGLFGVGQPWMEPAGGALLRTLKGHAESVECSTVLSDVGDGRLDAAFGGVGTYVVSGSYDKTIKIWNPLTGACVQTLKGHSRRVLSVTVLYDRSTNGRLSRALCGAGENGAGDDGCRAFVVSGSVDETIKIWNPLTVACVQTLKGHSNCVESVTVLYDRSTSGRLSRALCGAGEDSAVDDGCRAFVVSGSHDETIKIWNPLTGACVQTWKGHSYSVYSVTVLYDRSTKGRLSRALCGAGENGAGDDGCRAFVVSGSRDETIKIWNPLTGACVKTLKGHSCRVLSVTVLYDHSTDGRLSRALCGVGDDGAGDEGCRVFVVSGSADWTIKIWKPLTGACVQTLEGHSYDVSSVTVLYDRSTSGRLSRALCGAGEDGAGDDGCRAFVVSGSPDKTIKIWNPMTGACVQTLKGHSNWVNYVTVLEDHSLDGRMSRALCDAGVDGAGDDGCRAFVVSGSWDKTIKIWNPLTGACVQTMKGHSGYVYSVAVLYDRSTSGRLSRALCDAGVDGAGDDGCRAFVVSGSWDETIKIWNPLTRACMQTLKGHSCRVLSVTVLYDRSTSGRLSRAFCGAGEDGADDDGCRAFVVSGSDDETIKIWNPLTGACVKTLKGHSSWVFSITVLYDHATSGRLSRALCGKDEDDAGYQGCRAFVVSGSEDKTIKIWNLLTGACVQTLKGHSYDVKSVTVLYDRSTSDRFSRALCGAGEDDAGDDGCRAFVVSGSVDKTIKIWNPLTVACVQTLKGHSNCVESVTVLYDRSRSGRLSHALCCAGVDGAGDDGCRAFVVSGSWDKTIKIWNPLTGACVQTLKGHSDYVHSVTVLYDRSTNGRLSRALCGAGEDGAGDDGCRAFVVSGSEDQTIKIWNPLTGACLSSYSFDSEVISIAIKSNEMDYDAIVPSSSASKSNGCAVSVTEDDSDVVFCAGLKSGAVVSLKFVPPCRRRLAKDPFWNI